jgi:hypothetical protein
MATLDDILTTQKNGVVAINNLSQTLTSFYDAYKSVTGTATSNTLNTNSSVFTGSGRLIGSTIITAGSTAGLLYDSVLVSIIGGSYTSTSVTLVYGSSKALFASGDLIVVSGMTPSGYNGTYSVNSIGIDSTTQAPTVTYTNSTNAAITGFGIAFNGSLKYQRASLTASTTGPVQYNIFINNGLIYQPGTSQAANFTYSQ